MLDFMTRIQYTPVSEWFNFDKVVAELSTPLTERDIINSLVKRKPQHADYVIMGESNKMEFTSRKQREIEIRQLIWESEHNCSIDELSNRVAALKRDYPGIGECYDVGHTGRSIADHKRDTFAVMEYELLNMGSSHIVRIMTGKGDGSARDAIAETLNECNNYHSIVLKGYDEINTVYTIEI